MSSDSSRTPHDPHGSSNPYLDDYKHSRYEPSTFDVQARIDEAFAAGRAAGAKAAAINAAPAVAAVPNATGVSWTSIWAAIAAIAAVLGTLALWSNYFSNQQRQELQREVEVARVAEQHGARIKALEEAKQQKPTPPVQPPAPKVVPPPSTQPVSPALSPQVQRQQKQLELNAEHDRAQDARLNEFGERLVSLERAVGRSVTVEAGTKPILPHHVTLVGLTAAEKKQVMQLLLTGCQEVSLASIRTTPSGFEFEAVECPDGVLEGLPSDIKVKVSARPSPAPPPQH